MYYVQYWYYGYLATDTFPSYRLKFYIQRFTTFGTYVPGTVQVVATTVPGTQYLQVAVILLKLNV